MSDAREPTIHATGKEDLARVRRSERRGSSAGYRQPAGWDRTADVVIVGSGVAGLTAALGASRGGRRVLLVTKDRVTDGCTGLAQGGIAAALGVGDTPDSHLRDTVTAGAGLCDETAARELVERGPESVRALVRLGATFDPDDPERGSGREAVTKSGQGASGHGPALTREGGHSLPRIVHAGGDATGREVVDVLASAVRRTQGIDVIEQGFALDLIRGPAGPAGGVRVGMLDGERVAGVFAVVAPSVVLACGGYGQMYATTSNPVGATGDGLALALRAGAEVADVEFVQFHPTVLYSPAGMGHVPLISEAMRGEGAVLVDANGARVMTGEHPLEDLAPRDVVARTIARRMAAAPGGVRDHVYLDARGLGPESLARRFPNIVAACRARGIDPATEPIPVAPAAHYACGGVRVDPYGRTSVAGLFAVGEVACTGVHGANRLASNSLLEGLVMGDLLAGELPPPEMSPPRPPSCPGEAGAVGDVMAAGLMAPEIRPELATAMSRHAGVLRDAGGLALAADALERLARLPGGPVPSRAGWEAANLHTVATAVVAAARMREESRGCHTRTDHSEPDPAWQGRLLTRMREDGELLHRHIPASGEGAG